MERSRLSSYTLTAFGPFWRGTRLSRWSRVKHVSTTPSALPHSVQIATPNAISIFKCDREMRISQVLYSDHIAEPQQFIGRTDFDWLSQEDAEVVMSIKRRCLDEQRPVREQFTVTWEGGRRVFDLLVVPDVDEAGVIHGITCMIRDAGDGPEHHAPAVWMRRLAEILTGSAKQPETEELLARYGDLAIDAALHELRGPGGSARLSRIEWLLLQHLLRKPGSVVSREALLDNTWGHAYEDEPSLLHDTVSRLRRRMRDVGCSFEFIETIHGVGYRFRLPEDDKGTHR